MKGKEWLLAVVMGILFPALFFAAAEKVILRPRNNPVPTVTETELQLSATQPTEGAEASVNVLQSDGTVREMELEVYLVGVLLGEMPMDFHIEALKAQAVVARTYTLKRSTAGQKHASGGVCTEPSCCQAYRSVESYLAGGGTQEGADKAAMAVEETAGQVLTYNGMLIEATYFSCSGGRTEDALAVWGTDIPYLQAVDSPGEENAAHYTDSVSFSAKTFANLLGISPQGAPASWFGAVTYTDGGGVDTMQIGGTVFKGTELRQKLDLRSTAFSVTVIGDTVYVYTRGFGHRVGMSQYGAEAMAVTGKSYDSILAHYYPQTSLVPYPQN